MSICLWPIIEGSSFLRPPHMVLLQGHWNPKLPIRSSLSEDGRLAICGSEDGLVHVWDAGPDREVSWGGECIVERPCVHGKWEY